ncbi:Zinc finger (C3HC4-type RING finger) family protein isoform 1 [Hibiscus syriacus]|uniref:Zinc finger (C3HC4-type RING finger) family protein isoform 1 n=1 Tax=Hibiscus syriacus TaxID=106335 RepID=A0A6A2X809_HIBSY|nr:Zinc finger (C3HC4-type RING finger) family protein isoform 1 [Hibiscus syriacus]
MNPRLLYIAELTPPSYVFRATGKFTQPTNYSRGTLGHNCVTPVMIPPLPSFAKQSNLFSARIAIGKGKATSFPRLRCTIGGPIEGFTGCPSVTELVSFVGIEDLGDKAPILSEREGDGDGVDDGWLDLLTWETPVISSFDDLLVSGDFDHGFKPTDVLPLPKNRNASCGQHKVEVIHQLRELARSEPTLSFGKTVVEAIDGFQPRMPDADNLQPGTVHTSCKNDTDPISFPAYESSALRCFNDNVETTNQVFVPLSQLKGHTEEIDVAPHKHLGSSKTMPVSDSLGNQLQHQNDAGTTSAPPKVAVHELNSQERETAISRYKDKRKTRRFDKHIRYESRKVRAESRTRIKGRFAKIER